MIVWSGATFILRWSCFIRGSSVFMLNRNMIFQGFPSSHLQLIEGFRVGLILHSLFPPHFSITAHHFDFPILQQNSFLHPSIIRWYLNCLSCWADIFPTSIFHLLGPPSSLSSQQSIQKVPFLTKSWREGKCFLLFWTSMTCGWHQQAGGEATTGCLIWSLSPQPTTSAAPQRGRLQPPPLVKHHPLSDWPTNLVERLLLFYSWPSLPQYLSPFPTPSFLSFLKKKNNF